MRRLKLWRTSSGRGSPARGRAVRSDPPAPWAALDELDEYHALCERRLEHTVPVTEPLVLVSQIQRSGGTLLSQLLDGHPECHSHPHELKIGRPRKDNWPQLDLSRPETWFEALWEKRSMLHFQEGYRKTSNPDEQDVFPFLFLPRLQKDLFDRRVAVETPSTERGVLDAYFASYFNAWLDNQNLYTGPKKVVTAFTPRLGMDLANVERFFAAYPDGTLISIVRDPRAWFESARKWRPQYYGELDVAIGLWRRSATAAVEAKGRFGERVVVLAYENLVRDTASAVARVAERIGIRMSDELLLPTFNGRPIRANSSDTPMGFGVLPERATAYRSSLDRTIVRRIDELSADVYERAVAAVDA